MLFRVVTATKFSLVARCAAQYNIPGITRICQRQYESITYSGGQASVGQGGFYGSGKFLLQCLVFRDILSYYSIIRITEEQLYLRMTILVKKKNKVELGRLLHQDLSKKLA
mmetsp:Transcript_26676/g.38247  ORF Transcript_26676/g.38247 Transcript_26676/m.38247 type:complete len:111 (-) Transcript_26676:384-716(-)